MILIQEELECKGFFHGGVIGGGGGGGRREGKERGEDLGTRLIVLVSHAKNWP